MREGRGGAKASPPLLALRNPQSPDARQEQEPPGTLYVVATPIGNLGDLSPRAAAVLREVDLVAAEDTREAMKLLRHVGGRARLTSVHAHSDDRRLEEVVAALGSGRRVALVTDAGTPGVSDPGPDLVARARRAGYPVVAIPGPSAVTAALSASGLPGNRYRFLGFPPRRGEDRRAWLAEFASGPETVVCFEAPGRLGALLRDLEKACGPDRRAAVGRELTKRFEEIRTGDLGELARQFADEEVRGECTVVVEGRRGPQAEPEAGQAERLARALRDAGVEGRRAAQVLESVAGLSRNEAYRLAMGSER